MDQIGETPVSVKRTKKRQHLEEDQSAIAVLERFFKPYERLVLFAQQGVDRGTTKQKLAGVLPF